MSENYKVPESFNRFQTAALGVGGLGVVACIIGMFIQPEQALRGWLLGFIFWAGIGIGGLGILLLQYVTGGAWGVVIRRVAEACSRTIVPGLLVLFLPIAIGVYQLYDWANLYLLNQAAPPDAPVDAVIAWRGWFMDPKWWIVRSIIYFGLFLLMSWFLNRWSLQQDRAESPEKAAELLGKATKLSGGGIVLFVLVVTMASIDWTMTLEPHWFSTIWGFLFVAGWALSCFCFSVAVLAPLSNQSPLNKVLGKRHFHDIGKLMLALVMVWAYFNFSQYLIIWSGNLTEETPFYMIRGTGVWGVIGLVLVFFHFAFPFLILLMQDFKRHAKWLAGIAIFILCMRLLDMYYIIGPSPMIGESTKHLMSMPFRLTIWDFVATIGIGGVWLWLFFYELKQRPLVPFNDPMFKNAIKHGKGH